MQAADLIYSEALNDNFIRDLYLWKLRLAIHGSN